MAAVPGAVAAAPPAPGDPRRPPPAPARRDGRPEWWLDAAAVDASQASACGEADGATLADARRLAVERAAANLHAATATDAAEVSTPKSAAERLRSGRFRVFVLVTAPLGPLAPHQPPRESTR